MCSQNAIDFLDRAYRAGSAGRDVWLTCEADVKALIELDPSQPVVIRYRGDSEGRLTVVARNVLDAVARLESTGHYVRDMFVSR